MSLGDRGMIQQTWFECVTTECKIMTFLQGQYMPQHNDLKVLFLTKEDYTIWNVLGNKDIGII